MNILLVCAHATFRFGHRGDINNAEKPFYLGRNLADQGHNVTLVYQNPYTRREMFSETYKGLTVLFLPDMTPPHASHRRLVSRGVARGLETAQRMMLMPLIKMRDRFDVVHVFWPGWFENFIPLRLAKNLSAARTVIDLEDRMGGREGYVASFPKNGTLLNWAKSSVFTLLENASTRLADAAIASTERMMALLHTLGVERNRMFKIPRGVDTILYRPIERQLARAATGLQPEGPVVGYLGGSLRLPAYHEVLLKAFSQVRLSRPDCKLLLIGRRIPVSVKTTIAKLDLEGAVVMTEALPLEEVPFYLASADVLLLPLMNNFVDSSRWPNRLLEYMACGRPVVVSSVGEGARIVQNHACGSIAEPDNPSSFAEEITYLLKHRKEAEEMGVRSRLAVERDYTWERVSRETEAVYSTLK